MPFPFLPGGALLALAVLGGAFAVFAAGLRLLDRAATTARDSIAPGIVAGFRGWSEPVLAPAPAPSGSPMGGAPWLTPPAAPPPDLTPTVHDLAGSAGIPVERLHRR